MHEARIAINQGGVLGDVETSKVVKPTTEDGKKVIEGLSGRKLILGDWTNPSDEYRIGLKRAYELFPSDLCSRIKAVSQSSSVLQGRTGQPG